MSITPIAYQIMTDRITKLLESGVAAWQKPWNAEAGMPRNLFSQRAYRGINIWMLGAMGYESPFWGTMNQVNQAGGSVKKGESPTYIVYWSKYMRKDKATGDETPGMVLKFFRVFNSQQIEGVAIPQLPELAHEHTPLEACEKVVGNYPNRPTIIHGSSQAYYRPSTDTVAMPDMRSFDELPRYYSTLFHELTHSTGHKDRLDRDLHQMVRFGERAYAREELIAEMGAAYLCGHCGIENATIDQSASYLKGWLSVLRNEPKMLVLAAAKAQRAVDHILNASFREPGEE